MANSTFDLKATLSKLSGSEEEAEQGLIELYSHFAHQIVSCSRKYFKSNEIVLDIVTEVYNEIWKQRKELIKLKDFELFFFQTVQQKAYEVITRNEKVKERLLKQEEERRKRSYFQEVKRCGRHAFTLYYN